MIDIHSHVIPYIDDGAKTIDVAISMLKKAEESGTKKIILTPHYFGERFNKTITQVKALAQEVKDLAKEQNINIEIYCGQEIFYTSSLLEDLKEGRVGTLNDSRYMLIEFNMDRFDKSILLDLYELKHKGIVPIIAHPERYQEFINEPSYINDFIDEGVLFQLNTCCMSDLFGKDVRKTAELFLKNNIYSFVGSDAHNTRTRSTDMQMYKSKIEKINSKFINASIKNGEKLLKDEEVKFKGSKIEKRSNFFFSLFIN
ncbi:MAG: tyrosine-protein phosphatase [Sarcina sp.]